VCKHNFCWDIEWLELQPNLNIRLLPIQRDNISNLIIWNNNLNEIISRHFVAKYNFSNYTHFYTSSFKTPVKPLLLLCSQVQKRTGFHNLPVPPSNILSWSMRLYGNQATRNDEEDSVHQRFPWCRPVATDNVCNIIPLAGDFKREGLWMEANLQPNISDYSFLCRTFRALSCSKLHRALGYTSSELRVRQTDLGTKVPFRGLPLF
jgi:hypothetical protein